MFDINIETKQKLDFFVDKYNRSNFIEKDPISLPHQFSKKEDIEVIGLLVATISWGNRNSILKSAYKMVELMNNQPYDFIMNYKESDLAIVNKFKHRTFNGFDFHFFTLRIKEIYLYHNGLESVFTNGFAKENEAAKAITHFRNIFIPEDFAEIRTSKHIANPLKGSASKRLNMFLRWMVRKDNNGVDFGIWNKIPTSKLSCPLDVHSGRSARDYKLLFRKQNDLKAVNELDYSLRKLDMNDPVKYDYALFGMGIENKL